MPATTKERVSRLEETLNRFILNTDRTLYLLSQDTKDFKEEMKDFKDEMKDFKDEMKDFKEEVRKSIADSEQMRKDMNKKWGELANKLGTFAEDIAAPNIPRIARTKFKETEDHVFMTNLRKDHPTDKAIVYEFDAVLETKHKVFLLETKYTVRNKYIESLPRLIENFKTCFPNYANKELIIIFASMNMHESTVKRLTKMSIYAMAMGAETMELLNFEALQK